MDPVKLTIDGTEYTLPELSTYDKHRVRMEYRKSEKNKILENAALAHLDPLATFRALSEFDADPPTEWVNFVNEFDGMFVIIQFSLEKTGLAAVPARDLSRRLMCKEEELRDVVGVLAHLRRVPVDADPKAKKPRGTETYGDEAAGGEEPADDNAYATYAGEGDAEDPTRAAVTGAMT